MNQHDLILKLAPVIVASERLLEDSPERAVYATIVGLGNFEVDEDYIRDAFNALFDYIAEAADGRV
jgi:hypothetical protein